MALLVWALETFVANFRWVEWVALVATLRGRPWNCIDATWLLLRLTCVPVKASGVPSVLVMGGSVSAGRGVGNDPTRAWHAFLGDAKPTVHFKNAVDPSYFLHCAHRFVDRAYDVVLLDLAANLFDSDAQASLVALVRRMRCLSNATSVAVVNWPGVIHTNASRVATLRTGATLLEVPHGPDLYSTDNVHPNALGHARIAERVRKYLAGPLNDWHTPEHCAPIESETCYPQATEMPVVRDITGEPHGWKLVDDSPTPDRVHKYGWASSTPGANLTLVIPQPDTCGAVVTLAYLAANDTGPFRLTCDPGCACTKIRTYHQWHTHPFPIVTGREDCTGAIVSCDHMKLTRDTGFTALREREAPCRVTVTALTPRRVRLDGFYVQEPSAPFVRYARFSPPSTAEQRWFGTNALKTQCA